MDLASDHLFIQRYNRIVLVSFQKDRILDAKDITAIGQDLNRLADITPKISLILDLHAVTAMSSQMLGKLIALHKLVKTVKGRLALTNVQPKVLSIFTMTKLDKVLKIEPDARKLLLYWQRKPL